MIEPEDLPTLSREDLLALVAALHRQLAKLTASHAALRAEIEQRKRSGPRQAAPFATGTQETAPQRPGRTSGTGTCRSREAPPPEALTAPPVDVPVTLETCPRGGGPLAEARVDVAYTTALPARPRPPVTQSRVGVWRGLVCGRQGRGQPPARPPDPYGATAHRVGERVMAAAQVLPDGVGGPVRNIPAVLAALPGGG